MWCSWLTSAAGLLQQLVKRFFCVRSQQYYFYIQTHAAHLSLGHRQLAPRHGKSHYYSHTEHWVSQSLASLGGFNERGHAKLRAASKDARRHDSLARGHNSIRLKGYNTQTVRVATKQPVSFTSTRANTHIHTSIGFSTAEFRFVVSSLGHYVLYVQYYRAYMPRKQTQIARAIAGALLCLTDAPSVSCQTTSGHSVNATAKTFLETLRWGAGHYIVHYLDEMTKMLVCRSPFWTNQATNNSIKGFSQWCASRW